MDPQELEQLIIFPGVIGFKKRPNMEHGIKKNVYMYINHGVSERVCA
jgi:hypothetical protein